MVSLLRHAMLAFNDKLYLARNEMRADAAGNTPGLQRRLPDKPKINGKCQILPKTLSSFGGADNHLGPIFGSFWL
jgi:hypothetical protein